MEFLLEIIKMMKNLNGGDDDNDDNGRGDYDAKQLFVGNQTVMRKPLAPNVILLIFASSNRIVNFEFS